MNRRQIMNQGWSFCSVLLLLFSGPVLAGGVGGVPASGVQPLDQVELAAFPTLDLQAVAREDTWRQEQGLPFRFAISRETNLGLDNSGTWEETPAGRLLWRLRLSCPEVLSLNLGFTVYRLPTGATLKIYAADRQGPVLEFGAEDNRSHGQLWTPVVLGSELVVELEVSFPERKDVRLEIGQVGCGYRYFGEDFSAKSGSCNIDVICAEGDSWRDDIPSVGAYSFGGSVMCTGALINNTALDQRPLFLTANHCGISAENANTVVVYWNFESPTCGAQSGGSLEQTTLGSALLANSIISDFALLELAESPDPVFGVGYAGWDRSNTTPASAVAIHHPSGDEKSISFEDDPLSITSYNGAISPGNGTHLRVADWDLGTTEPGSSGSPLFNSSHRIVGQLHGGLAACNNNEPDWYGRFFTSWEGGGTAENRLRDYLDPSGTGALVLNRLGGDDPEPPVPSEMEIYLSSVVPNPSLVNTVVTYQLNQAAGVRARVLNISGQVVRDLGTLGGNRGDNLLVWDGHDDAGRPVAAGLYVFYLESAGKTARGQVIRLK